MFYDLPSWRLNKQLSVMTPKNTFGLQINKHLIPRSPYSLRRMIFGHSINGSVKTYNARTLKSWASKDIKAFTTKDIRTLAPRQISNFNIKPLSVINLGGLTPSEMRSFSVNDMRSFSVHDLNRMHLNSRVISSHTISGLMAYKYRAEGINYLRVSSPAYAINNSFELTSLGKRVVNNWHEGSQFMEEQSFSGSTLSGDAPTSSVSEGDAGSYGSW